MLFQLTSEYATNRKYITPRTLRIGSIDFTPEMIGRGVDELRSYDWECDDPRKVVSAMIKAILEPEVLT